MSLSACLLSFVAFICLALSVPRHCRHIFGRDLEGPVMPTLRIAGWVLLGASLAASIAEWGAFVGIVGWIGILTVSAIAVTLSLTYGPKPPWLLLSQAKP